MLRKLVVAGTLIGLMILAVSLFTAPASSAASSKALRYKIVCRCASYEVVKRHHQRLVVRDRARFVTVYAVRRYRIVKRARTFVVLRKLAAAQSGSSLAAITGDPVSVGRPSEASSASGADPASAANDGLSSTYWAATSRAYPQSWTVDLGTPLPVDGLRSDWHDAGSVSTTASK